MIGVALALLILVAAMALAWAVQRITSRSGWIDTIWSFAVGSAALAGTVVSVPASDRRLVVTALVLIWSLRLGGHIARRTHGAGDDPRYAALMTEWGPAAPLRLFQFLQMQALAGFVLVSCVLLAVINPAPVGAYTLTMAALGLTALAGEAIADWQLQRFRSRGLQNAVCDEGLWARSRHPNYFFEWLFWLSIALIALERAFAFPIAVLALLAPVMMYWLLVHVSGIPHLEAHMLRSRGDVFRAYQQRVPKFFPRLMPLRRGA